MTFEDEKLAIANQVLKETEKRCSSSTGWFRMGKHSKESTTCSYADHLETQIIKADSQLYLATLTFLQQDISGYFKGAWILRKSWKHYMQTYNEILELYKEIVGDLPDEEKSKDDKVCPTDSADVIGSTVEVPAGSTSGLENSAMEANSDTELFDQNDLLHPSSSGVIAEASEVHKPIMRNGYIPKSKTTTFTNEHRASSSASSTCSSFADADAGGATMKKSHSMQSALSKYTHINFASINSNLHYISSTLNPFNYLGV